MRQMCIRDRGDATLAGAVYGIYKGDTLIDEYVTDENGQFTTKEYICCLLYTSKDLMIWRLLTHR